MALTVSQLNEYVHRSLAADPMLRNVYVTGEISNFKRHASGHWYFTLKDEEAAINCAMFRQAASSVRFYPENGRRVRVFGTVGLYTKTGAYQLYADAMEPDGVGDLYLQFEALKRKLASEGLFDPSLKKPIPFLPKGIGIVTSKTGAVVHDISRVAWRRFPGMPLYLCPVKVQGDGAAREIADGLLMLDAMPEVDVIIVGRGGGSMEDLWAFNEESVARAIALCQTPVISAVGHETDFSISDFVADLRAATPSAAAEMAVPMLEMLAEAIEHQQERLDTIVDACLNAKRLALTQIAHRLSQSSPAQKKERMLSQINALRIRIETSCINQLAVRKARVEKTQTMLTPKAEAAMDRIRKQLDRATLVLKTSGPIETMKRGYAVVTSGQKLVRSAADVQAGDRLHIHLADGRIEAVAQEESL